MRIMTWFDRSSTNRKNSDPLAKVQSVINMKENMDPIHYFWNNSDLSRVGGNSDFPRESHHVGAPVSVLRDIHTTLCSVSNLHVHTTLTLLVVL